MTINIDGLRTMTLDNIAARAVDAAQNTVVESTGYRSKFEDTDYPQASRFVRVLERELQNDGATLLETSDPKRSVEQRRRLPRNDWPYSIWQCPDDSVIAVFEARAEVAKNMGDLLRYAKQGNQPQGDSIRYAGVWDGERAEDLATSLHKAAARVLNGEQITLDNSLVLAMIEIPYADRVPDDHPLHQLGVLHGIDNQGKAVISAEGAGALFVMPTDSASLSAECKRSQKQANQLSGTPLGSAFKQFHEQTAKFYDKAAALVDGYTPAQQQAQTDEQESQKAPTQDQKQPSAPALKMR